MSEVKKVEESETKVEELKGTKTENPNVEGTGESETKVEKSKGSEPGVEESEKKEEKKKEEETKEEEKEKKKKEEDPKVVMKQPMSKFKKIFLYVLVLILIAIGLFMIIGIIFALFAYPYAKKYEQMKADAGIEPYSSSNVFWNSLRGLFFINDFKSIYPDVVI